MTIMQSAMRYGTFMGALWAAKFLLLAYSFISYNDATLFFGSLLFMVGTLVVPFIAVKQARSYRREYCGDAISYMNALWLVMLIYLFASLLAAVVHYIYFTQLDHGRFIATYLDYLNQSGLEKDPQLSHLIEGAREMLASLTPSSIVWQLLSNNLTYGVLQSLIIAIFVAKKPR